MITTHKFHLIFKTAIMTASLCALCACGSGKENSSGTSADNPSTESTVSSTQVASDSKSAESSSVALGSKDTQGKDKDGEKNKDMDKSEASVSKTGDSDAVSDSQTTGQTSAAPAQSSGTDGQASMSQAPSLPPSDPAGDSGKLSALHVDGTYLVNELGEHVQLYGMSTHGLSFFPQFVNYDTFATLHDDWQTNCVRLAMYTAEYNGYCTGGDQETLKNLIRNGVNYATELGMYVIVDWHILSDQDPNIYKQDAKDFFSQMSAEFADYTNVLYEICNEPNGYATWESVKSYAEEVIPCIRENDPDAVILVGSPTWSQDIDKALANPLDFDNVMYTLHFYAATHKDDLRNRLDTCVSSGLPVFISEFGMCDASGNGGNDFDSAQKWLDLLNQYDISFMCWNLANKNESSSVIRGDVSSLSGWSEDELNESGRWIRNVFRSMD